ALDEPERADRERTFRPPHVVATVSIDETPLVRQMLRDHLGRRLSTLVVRIEEAAERYDERRGIELVAPERLSKGTHTRIPAFRLNRMADLVARLCPRGDLARAADLRRQSDRAIHRDPRHQLRMKRVLLRPAEFPDALVGLRPLCRRRVGDVDEKIRRRRVE